MQIFTNVQSSAESVKPVEYDDYHVYVNEGITKVDSIEENEFIGWHIAKQTMYDKNEYIMLLQNQVTDTELAIVELYEGVLGNG